MIMHTMKSVVVLGNRSTLRMVGSARRLSLGGIASRVLVLAELSSGLRCLKNLGNGGRFDGSRGIAAIGETGRQRH